MLTKFMHSRAKAMNEQRCLGKSYLHDSIQNKWNQRWQKEHCFEFKAGSTKPTFTVLMPPPNITGILHMGHTLNATLQDILCRWERLQGKNVLWIPGTDHSGIATQTKVEKILKAESGVTRQQLGRTAFLERVEQWRNKHGTIIFEQLKTLGVSCDWTKETYTLDPEYRKLVQSTFVKLYERGYIYKGKRLVNWCPVSQTALSDEEVLMKPTEGKLYTIRYALVEHPDRFIEIATTRPETIMGDTAIAVHPDDPRYTKLIGHYVRCPFDAQRTIPIIGDAAVEQDFGTGALKITPAHDPTDFEVGKRHQLPFIEVIDASGHINQQGAPFEGMDRMEARQAVVDALREKGLLVKEEAYHHSVGYSERANVPIEPRLSTQWFLRYPKTEEAKKLATQNLIQFIPEHWIKTYLHWLDNLQDWCISRQLWWGHRIPVWYNKQEPTRLHVSVTPPSDPDNWTQDPDVLDTWFSAWLWPIGTLKCHSTATMDLLKLALPTDILVSGSDILFFWITRMLIATLEFLEDRPIEQRIPFKKIYLTGIVRDSLGRKMSKSLGNSPDPVDLIHKYGADGVRIGLISIAPQGLDIRFDEQALVQGRNFCTKLWNACRYRTLQSACGCYNTLDDYFTAISAKDLSLYDRHLLHQLSKLIKAHVAYFQQCAFTPAIKALQQGFRDLFCDWYLEVQKQQSAPNFPVQDLFLRQTLLLLHPYAPYITEELWEQLHLGEGLIHTAELGLERIEQWIQTLNAPHTQAIDSIECLRQLVGELRSFKSEQNVQSPVIYGILNEPYASLYQQQQALIIKLVGLKDLQWISKPLRGAAQKVLTSGSFFIESNTVNESLNTEQIQQAIATLTQHIQTANQKLNNQQFLAHAPKAVIDGVQRQLDENRKKLEALQKLLG